MNKFLIAFISLLLSIPIFAAEGFSSLEEQMTGKEFSAAGLDKLSQSELDSLNAWIHAHSLATLATRKGTTADSGDSGDSSDNPKKSRKEQQSPATWPAGLAAGTVRLPSS
jgi:hypothetical protein